MRTRKPRNAALEFAKAFTYLCAQEACRQGKRRTLDASKFEKWCRQIIRSAGGDPDKIGAAIGKRLHWLVYDQRRTWERDVDFCIRRGKAFAHRHKVLIAEQVLTGEAESFSLEDLKKRLGSEELIQEIAEHLMKDLGPDEIIKLFGKKKGRRAHGS
jgi:hypothetical protein